MLSGETRLENTRSKRCRMMDKIARSVEPSLVYERRVAPGADVAEILTHGACDLADDVGARGDRRPDRDRGDGAARLPLPAAGADRGGGDERRRPPAARARVGGRAAARRRDRARSRQAGPNIIGRVLGARARAPGRHDRAHRPGRRPPSAVRRITSSCTAWDEPEARRHGSADARHVLQRHGRRLHARVAREAVAGGSAGRPTSSGGSAARSTSTTSGRSSERYTPLRAGVPVQAARLPLRARLQQEPRIVRRLHTSGPGCTRTRRATHTRHWPPAWPPRTSCTAGRT